MAVAVEARLDVVWSIQFLYHPAFDLLVAK